MDVRSRVNDVLADDRLNHETSAQSKSEAFEAIITLFGWEPVRQYKANLNKQGARQAVRGSTVRRVIDRWFVCRPLTRGICPQVTAVVDGGHATVMRFQPGDRVFWWKRITRVVEYPYCAEITAVGPKRITIMVEDIDETNDRLIRHVAAENLQPLAGYYVKAADQGQAILEPTASWGRFSRYLEIGEDLRPMRQVDVFEDGHLLSYDRVHWVDDFGMLSDAKINRNRKVGPWGSSEEIEAAEFGRVWSAARASQMWSQQMATAQMASMGVVPTWLTIKGWRPGRTSPCT